MFQETCCYCVGLWARTTSTLTVKLPCVVTNHKSQRSTLKNQMNRTVFIHKVTSTKVRTRWNSSEKKKSSERYAPSRIFYFFRREWISGEQLYILVVPGDVNSSLREADPFNFFIFGLTTDFLWSRGMPMASYVLIVSNRTFSALADWKSKSQNKAWNFGGLLCYACFDLCSAIYKLFKNEWAFWGHAVCTELLYPCHPC